MFKRLGEGVTTDQVVTQIRELIEHVLAKVRTFSADLPQFDDITLLVVRYAGE